VEKNQTILQERNTRIASQIRREKMEEAESSGLPASELANKIDRLVREEMHGGKNPEEDFF